MKQDEIMLQMLKYQELLHLSSAAVSRMSGIPKNTYYYMRKGDQFNSFNAMEQIANTLGLELVLTMKRDQ